MIRNRENKYYRIFSHSLLFKCYLLHASSSSFPSLKKRNTNFYENCLMKN